MLWHIMISWTLRFIFNQLLLQWLARNIRVEGANIKIWISLDQEELVRWNKKLFSQFLKNFLFLKYGKIAHITIKLISFNVISAILKISATETLKFKQLHSVDNTESSVASRQNLKTSFFNWIALLKIFWLGVGKNGCGRSGL